MNEPTYHLPRLAGRLYVVSVAFPEQSAVQVSMPSAPGAQTPTIKASLDLPQDTLEALQRLADEINTSVAELIRAAISTDRLLRDAVDRGGRVLIEDDRRRYREVVIPR